jgi:hypothetical protein
MLTEKELQEKWDDLVAQHLFQRNGLESVLPKFLIWALLKMQEPKATEQFHFSPLPPMGEKVVCLSVNEIRLIIGCMIYTDSGGRIDTSEKQTYEDLMEKMYDKLAPLVSHQILKRD